MSGDATGKTVDMAGKVAVVTGGTSGIGRALALRLAQAKCGVTILGRNQQRGQAVVDECNKVAPDATHAFIPVDGFSCKDNEAFARKFMETSPRLDYLVLSQGMATTQGFTPTAEGFDQKLTIHYFSRMALIRGLMPLLNKTAADDKADVRVLSVLSGGVHKPYIKYKEDFQLKDTYSIVNAANAAGFYNDLGLDALAEENPEVGFVHAAPGFVATNWGTELPSLMRWGVRVLQTMGKSPAKCANYMLEGLVSPAFAKGFHTMGELGKEASITTLHTPDVRNYVWGQTLEAIAKSVGSSGAVAETAEKKEVDTASA